VTAVLIVNTFIRIGRPDAPHWGRAVPCLAILGLTLMLNMVIFKLERHAKAMAADRAQLAQALTEVAEVRANLQHARDVSLDYLRRNEAIAEQAREGMDGLCRCLVNAYEYSGQELPEGLADYRQLRLVDGGVSRSLPAGRRSDPAARASSQPG